MDEDICLECEAVLEGTEETCPRCGVSIVYCSNPSCGKPLVHTLRKCPYCGSPNLEYEPEVVPQEPDAPIAQSPLEKHAIQVDDFDADELNDSLADELDAGMDALALSPAFGPINTAPSFSLPSVAASSPAHAPIGGMPPFLIEHDVSQVYKQGERGLLRLRLRPSALPANAKLSLELKASPEFQIEAKAPIAMLQLMPLNTKPLPPIRCLPKLAGAEAVELTAWAATESDEPLGRWQGTLTLRVTPAEDKKNVAIHVGGDMIDLGTGGGGLGDLLDPLSFRGVSTPTQESWQPVIFEADASYMSRLYSSTPSPLLEPPPDGNATLGEVFPSGPLLLIQNTENQQEELRVYWGDLCLVGRIPMPGEPEGGVHFRLAADNGNDIDTRRMSRCHVELALRQGRAWVRDVSTNGTSLGGERLTKGAWQLIGRGDKLSLRQVAEFNVHLQGDKQGVYAVFLSRTLPGGKRQTYALANRALFWPTRGQIAFSGPGIGEAGAWIVSRASPQGRGLATYSTAGGAWQSIGSRQQQKLMGPWTMGPAGR